LDDGIIVMKLHNSQTKLDCNYLAYQECQISRPLPLELTAESQILPKPVVGSRRLQNQDFALLSDWVANPG